MSYTSNKLINGLDVETTIADTDELIFGDVSDTNRAKKITFANLKTEIVGDDTAFVRKTDYDANTILYATSDNTPVALTVGTNSVVGRVAGAITTLAIDSDLTSVSASDDTVPSAKATKTALDLKANDADVVHDTGNETIAGIKTFSSDPLIPDEAYDATAWNGVLEPPTKNAVRDKFVALEASIISAGTCVTAIPRPLMPYSGVGTRALNNNVDGYLHMFTLDKQITVNKISFNITAVGSSGTFNVGIFSEDGQTRHISVTTGTISGTGIASVSVSAVTLSAGNYYLLLGSVSSANITVSQWSAASPASDLKAVSSEPTVCGTYTVSASTMPSTITLASISSVTDGAFVFRLDN